MFKSLGGMGDIAKMMKAAQEMQSKMEQLQQDMDKITVTGESGAGLVRATTTAKGELTALEIDPSILVASEKEVVEDLIVAAIRDAQGRAADRSRQELEKMQENLGLPPGFKLPF